MTDDRIWAGIRRAFERVFDGDMSQVGPATTADDVEDWDSVTNVELLVALELEFGVRFSTGEMARLRNVGELAERIAASQGEAAG